MLKPLAVLGLLALWSMSAQQGCNDLKKSVTHLKYYPIRDMRQTIAIDPQRTTWGAPDSLAVPTISIPSTVSSVSSTMGSPRPAPNFAANTDSPGASSGCCRRRPRIRA